MQYDYDIVVIGGGAAGLVAATGTAALGAKTALIEKNKLGGDCTWYGCIPSKSLLKSASIFSLLKRLDEFGIHSKGNAEYDAGKVMSHVRSVINKISLHHPAEVFEKRGIDVLFGAPKFVDARTIKLNSKHIFSKRFIICTGSHPLVPPIEGLKDIDYLTNENVFDLETLPRSMAVLGGGPIGLELSQALSRLGVEVTIIEMLDRILFREDREASDALTHVLLKEGIKILIGKKAVKFSKEGTVVVITLEDKNRNQSVVKVEKVLVAVGRSANVEGLELKNADIEYTNKGITVDSTLQTSAKNMYACGDVVGPYQFSHMAEYQAIIAVGNALFPFKRNVDYRAVPWATFTEPEVAHVGLTEEEARAHYNSIKVYRSNYSDNDRAVTDVEERGFAKVICSPKGHILGAHIVGSHAGELIHEFVLAQSAQLKITRLSSTMHIYPTLAQVVKRTADQPLSAMLKSKWFRFLSKLLLKFLR